MGSGKKHTLRILLYLLLAVAALIFINRATMLYYKSAYPMHYTEEVTRYSAEFEVAPELVFAVIRTESSFRPESVSSVGARGLMQLTEETFEWVKGKLEPNSDTVYDDMFDPEINIKYGTFLLSMLSAEFGSVENALCAYHAGWGNVKSWLENPEYSADGEVHTIPFKDTDYYVDKVTKTADVYSRLYK